MSDRGKLEKLTIRAYDSPNCQGKEIGRFEAYVNPQELTISHEVDHNQAQAPGTTNSRMDFKAMKPGDLTVVFFLDGTGADGTPVKSDSNIVQTKVAEFQQVTGYNGNLHRPNYLLLMWGTIQIRQCVLKSASIVYKLFKPNGVPLRAVITANFTEFSDDKTREAKAQNKSSDLTHRRILKGGDNLPLLCHEIYGDPRLYVKVAEANGLENFRNLPAGTTIFFPPLEK